jgi:voltage-gated potassium channel
MSSPGQAAAEGGTFVDRLVSRYGRHSYLAISLAAYLLADALFPDRPVLTYSILALIIVTGPLATARTHLQRWSTVGMAVLMVGLGYVASFEDNRAALVVANLAAIVFFLMMIFLISRALFVQQTGVTGETIWAAINVYVLFGLLFSFIYALVEVIHPGAYQGNLLGEGDDLARTFLYYSFVTMTTLGYGDITPKIQVAATLAYVQALIGQLYVAILIARLVSLYPGRRDSSDE